MFEIVNAGFENSTAIGRSPRVRAWKRWPLSCALLASALASGCLSEPGAPAESETDDSDTEGVLEVLSFNGSSSFNRLPVIISPETTTDVFGGMATADIDLDGTDDMLILAGKNESSLLLNDGKGEFDDASDWLPPLSAYASGPVFADLDGDGAPDLLVPNASDGSIGVFINDEQRRFEEIETGSGFEGTFAPALGAVAADIDRDGDLDVFVLRATGTALNASVGVLWLNDGDAHFSDRSAALKDLPVADATSALFVDANADLLPDLFITRGDGVTLLLNESKGDSLSFVEADLDDVPEVNGAFAVTAADLDNDRDLDFVLSGVGGLLTDDVADAGTPPSTPLHTLDAGAFDAGVASDGPGAGGPDASEASNLSDSGTSESPPEVNTTIGIARPSRWGKTRIIGNAESHYVPWPTGKGVAGRGSAAFCVADFNNDTYLDVFYGTAPRHPDQPRDDSDAGSKTTSAALYLQRGAEGGFIDGASFANLADVGEARSILCFDYDHDGDVDIFVIPFYGSVDLYINRLDPEVGPSNYVDLRIVGSDEHPSTLGAVVTVVTHGLVQTRSVGQNYTSAAQGSNLLHFGLGSNTLIDSIVIAWPDGAEESVFEDFATNATYTFKRQ